MGWGRWFLLGDFGQQMDIADQQDQIENLKQQLRTHRHESSSTEQRLEQLQRENDELKLYLAAVVRLLVAKQVATTAEVSALVAAVDREDGIEDQRFTGPVLPRE